jgi:large subunit ribosomal protein LX
MKIYKITGTFLMGDAHQQFTKEVLGKGKSDATERLYSELGSKHKVNRRNISIEKITEIKPEKVEDPIIKYKAGAGND